MVSPVTTGTLRQKVARAFNITPNPVGEALAAARVAFVIFPA